MHTVSQKLGSAAACVLGFSAGLLWKRVAKGDAPGWSSMTARRVDQTDMGTQGIPRFAFFACLFAMIGCENRAKRTHPQAARDLVALQPRAYAVAHQVFACETGVLEFSVAYDTELRIVGFHVNGNAMPATPR